MSGVLVVIPARWAASRFPGKLLADLGGEPLIVRTCERAAAMATADRVLVAVDDERLYAAVTAAGYEAVMTGEHACGTDRVGEAAAASDAEIVVNLQGDEPLLDPVDMDRTVHALHEDGEADIATLAHPFVDEQEWRDPSAVKVVSDDWHHALYFTRAPVPGAHPGGEGDAWRLARRHVGIYAYRREALARFLALAPHPLEKREGLEQLRGLAAGLTYAVRPSRRRGRGVDTPEDMERVRALWHEQ
ncbi:MAG TPA: 3-deoxy-manno-octulosonate cytidylyltransferase [Candidatus Krumholzibacteria bacterium]|nr:3-deoxy-manno-octulosonate cytidylyltransferase [Candidatus Krumholzibacteria bacterium]HRX52795.1 3-deoxy-manno-octulosonate cytidylyltransferase [Candidatus Krumholzibacteria bacterium]